MTELHKFSLKKISLPLLAMAFCIAITRESEARRAPFTEIYSTLTSDTIPTPKKNFNQISPSQIDTSRKDTTRITDTIPPTQRVDTFSLKLSKDTLDAPVNYEAEDSAVLFVKDQKFLLPL